MNSQPSKLSYELDVSPETLELHDKLLQRKRRELYPHPMLTYLQHASIIVNDSFDFNNFGMTLPSKEDILRLGARGRHAVVNFGLIDIHYLVLSYKSIVITDPLKSQQLSIIKSYT